MQWLLLPLAVAAGIASSFQAGSNSMLQKTSGSPLWAVTIATGVTFASSLVASLLGGAKLPAGATLAEVPWWGWIGGLFALCYVLSMVLVTPKLGAGVFLGLSVTAGVLTSLLLDHFGLMGLEVHPAGLWRLVGGALMIMGVALVAVF